jgi:hypothetical protein
MSASELLRRLLEHVPVSHIGMTMGAFWVSIMIRPLDRKHERDILQSSKKQHVHSPFESHQPRPIIFYAVRTGLVDLALAEKMYPVALVEPVDGVVHGSLVYTRTTEGFKDLAVTKEGREHSC